MTGRTIESQLPRRNRAWSSGQCPLDLPVVPEGQGCLGEDDLGDGDALASARGRYSEPSASIREPRGFRSERTVRPRLRECSRCQSARRSEPDFVSECRRANALSECQSRTRTSFVPEMPSTAMTTPTSCLAHSSWLRPPGGLRICRRRIGGELVTSESNNSSAHQKTYRPGLSCKLEGLADS